MLDLRTGPIINSGDVSNLALVLSVEFPTVGAAYKARGNSSYVASKKYIGYYNSTSCYRYRGTSADGYFEPAGATNSSYQCNLTGTGTGWSGNLLNFLNTSSIDVLRLALTGGDRFVDQVGNTVLQRAILPSDESSQSSSRNTNFFGGTNWGTVSLPAGTTTAALTPFGASKTVVVKACDDKIFFGESDTGQCSSSTGGHANLATTSVGGGTVTGVFKARVLVCDSVEGPLRSDLCRQQPDGNYKPVGEIQKNSDKVRVAAFGYLIDSATWGTGSEGSQYGGVLRAPMKFAGPTQKSSAGIVSANPEKEWDENTGVFVVKPINTSNESGYTTTGVINYVNKFGRLTRSDGVGVDIYKRRDPVGELYYEAVRYFQGLQPTPEAYAGTTGAGSATLLAGYPIYTNWTDPMQTSCQRNYAMVMGDNNASKDGYIPGSAISGQTRGAVSGNTTTAALNATTWTNIVQSFETNGTVAYTDSQSVNRVANGNSTDSVTGVKSGNTNLATKTVQDAASWLYAGVAYWANTQPIRPDKPMARVRTYVVDVDENGNGSLDGGGRDPTPRFSAMYLAGKYGGFADVGPDQSPSTGEGNPFKTYVNATLTSSTTEWLAADGSTSPTGYFLASQPERLIVAVRQIFAQASKPSGNLAGGSLSVTRLNQAQQSGAFYQAQINSTDWSGTVIRTQLQFNTSTQQLEASSTPVWDAANILTGVQAGTTTLAPIPTPANRNIVSYSATSRAGVTFTWAEIDTAVQTSLRKDPTLSPTVDPGPETIGQARLEYLRGVRTAEIDPNLNFRARRVIMGDSINSAPVLKGAPSSDILDSSYQAFVTANASRTPTVYVGTNDGMLHAFQAAESAAVSSNGRELFAYVPRAVSLKLNKLTDPAYVKEAYVDGAMAVNEARAYKSATGSVDWATVLVSGMGGGAKGLFALDVTSPSTFKTGNVLWEFTEADDPEMGHLLAEPKIVKLAMAGNANAAPDYKWFAMVTSGYNNYTGGGSGDKQALFLISLEKAPGTAWTLNGNYFKIYADNGTFAAANPSVSTGLGMPSIATGIAGNTLFAYAGDLQGNLWRWDLRGASSTWNSLSTPAKVLFVAKNAAGTATQPITVVPAVTLNPVGGYQIGFGTGKFIEPTDALTTSAARQSLYSIWDADDGKRFERVPTDGTPPTVNGLITRTLTVTSGTTTISITGNPFVYGTSAVDGSGQYRGWVADLSTNMERVVVDPTVDTGLMAVNSTIPSGDPCSATGASNQYRYNPTTGISFVTKGSLDSQGFLGSASLLQVGETVWTTRNSAGRYIVTRRIDSVSPGVGGGVSMRQSTVTSVAGRISWREITNFQ